MIEATSQEVVQSLGPKLAFRKAMELMWNYDLEAPSRRRKTPPKDDWGPEGFAASCTRNPVPGLGPRKETGGGVARSLTLGGFFRGEMKSGKSGKPVALCLQRRGETLARMPQQRCADVWSVKDR